MIEPFHDVRFPLDVAFGAAGGPQRRTEIVALASGHERRNQRWQRSRRRYDAGQGIRSLAELYEVVAFYEARRGPLHAFRYRDPLDHSSAAPGGEPFWTDQLLGTGDGERTTFPLVKRYGDEVRPITHPERASIRLMVGRSKEFGFTLEGGAVRLPAPAPAGEAVRAGFLFDVPVRFASDELSVSLTAFAAGEVPVIPLLEVLP